ncbi:MAG: Gfo/Idh/MocA family oxidoreductase [Bryobacterales bacterium]|nr:Gfo/Idh/MocA family oxidoreductase [Bryobacterales bacterium]
MNPPQRLRGALIGCGYFARIHMEAWQRLRDLASIEACCDIEPERASSFGGAHGIARSYDDYRRMLLREKPDFVDIVTRPDTHFEIAAAAADLGIPILCQKPLAPALEGAEQMVEYCEARGVRLMANENWRWQAWFRELKALLGSGVIGKPFYFALRHRVPDGVGEHPYARQPYFVEMPRLLLIETMIHFIDTARFLLGDLALHSAILRRVNPHVRGEDVVLLTFEGDGLAGMIDGNRLSPAEQEGPVMGDMRIEGDAGTLSLDGGGRIYIRPVDGPMREHSYALPVAGYRGDSAYQTLRHFVECLHSGREFETSGREYLKTTRLVFEAYDKAGWL